MCAVCSEWLRRLAGRPSCGELTTICLVGHDSGHTRRSQIASGRSWRDRRLNTCVFLRLLGQTRLWPKFRLRACILKILDVWRSYDCLGFLKLTLFRFFFVSLQLSWVGGEGWPLVLTVQEACAQSRRVCAVARRVLRDERPTISEKVGARRVGAGRVGDSKGGGPQKFRAFLTLPSHLQNSFFSKSL